MFLLLPVDLKINNVAVIADSTSSDNLPHIAACSTSSVLQKENGREKQHFKTTKNWNRHRRNRILL